MVLFFRELAQGATDKTKGKEENTVIYPNAGLTFMISPGADAVAAELVGHPEKKK